MISKIIESEESLVIKGESITYKLLRSKKRKHSIVMKIRADGCLQINVPFYTQMEVIEDFIITKYSWVQRKLTEQSSRKKTAILCYEDGEKHLFKGTEYPLQLVHSNLNKIEIAHGYIYVFHRSNSSVKSLLKKWYRQQALEYLTQRTELYANSHLLPAIKTVKVRYMKARWGSCSSDAVITYNIHLIKATVENIDYVILHELCHLIHPDHSSRFYQLQSKLNPNWKQQKHHLNHSDIPF
ncbi:MAG: M48 family metallopeptidase [Alcanivoracaceae bacterium]|nr:M48 family metallopeptidase [Alcanivoracaceae bacterium]